MKSLYETSSKINEDAKVIVMVEHILPAAFGKLAKIAKKVKSFSNDIKFDFSGQKFEIQGIPELEGPQWQIRDYIEMNSYYRTYATFWPKGQNWYVQLNLDNDNPTILEKLSKGEIVECEVISRKHTGSTEKCFVRLV